MFVAALVHINLSAEPARENKKHCGNQCYQAAGYPRKHSVLRTVYLQDPPVLISNVIRARKHCVWIVKF
jgi:hypothetical protein